MGLPFPLLADVDGEVSRKYDALIEQGGMKFSARKLVLIDKTGVVRYRDEQYAVGDPAAFEKLVGAMEKL